VRFVITAVGRPRDAALARAITEYETRAARYWPLEAAEIREGAAGGAPAESARSRQSEHLLQRVGDMRIVLCDRDGARRTSEEFARWMQQAREQGEDIAFVIGGAFGVTEALRAAAWSQLSLAPWTLPHELARLVLVEQLYRAGTIVRGEPYHK
jgi:23S rRNA (pseudouridine1915-N3)-methyltransferase